MHPSERRIIINLEGAVVQWSDRATQRRHRDDDNGQKNQERQRRWEDNTWGHAEGEA